MFKLCRAPRMGYVRLAHSIRHNTTVPPLAFVFDIVWRLLLRGANVIPAARRALALLEGDNPFRKKIPYVFLTNGGGISEEERSQRLTKQLGFQIEPKQCIQAHTILRDISHKYAEQAVLVLGGKLDTVRRIANGYGFKNAYTTTDILAWNPSIWPFHELTAAEVDAAKPVDFTKIRFAAIFVFHDPRNWALDVQIACDIIQSGGLVDGSYDHLESRTGEPVELVFCNPDLIWRSDFERPRLGQGAFNEAFQAVYKSLTDSIYPYVQYGKPTRATHRFAEGILAERTEELYGVYCKIPKVYMIGDNPESDIAGANAAKWSSVLVRTGVFDPQQGPPSHLPCQEVKDVEDAVRWAINTELTKLEN